ncbi:alpha/beta fold hydrolase [Streptomyces sp. SL13]|uniref:Alpha/beta fold hydrolase n=1 Tax=Streptantibioticus silvisoli TaxID=2705255 RepID=A0AA90GZS2_9ACTN|nr:alpha/beta fold hydrolase [Streptantibioticus silvisoli]MDI5969486.1 alpha/beta fold hydrolase [Streptantibioticus silvisoli]
MDVRMVDAGEVRLACRVSGNPDGAAVVLLHGLGKSGADWDAVAGELGRHRRVYAPDLRGHGDSDRPGRYSFELMRDDLGAMLKALELERVSLVGHSMGGVVAYLYASEHPERVERLVLEEVPPPVARERAVPERPDGVPGFDWDVVAPLHAQLADPAEDWQAGLDAITAPALLLGGGLRSHVPQDQIAAMARRLSRGCLVTIPCGHEIHAARPMEFAATLDGFLPGGVPGPATGGHGV